jgi:ATP-dependent metalloprotease
LERLAVALVEYETLDKEEMEKVVRGELLVGKIKADPNAMVKLPDSAPRPPSSSSPPNISLPPPPPGPIGLPGMNTGSSSKSVRES